MLPVTNRQANTLSGSSGNVAAAAAVATLTPSGDRVAHLGSFQARALGATAGLFTLITITGVEGGTVSIPFYFPTGVTVEAAPLTVIFPVPLRGAGPGTAIVVTLPSGGAGNTNAAISAQGYM